MDEMRALLQFGHTTSENVMQESGGALAWAAMLLKNDRNDPIKKCARV